MADKGVKVTTVGPVSVADDIVVLREGSVKQQSFANLSNQMAGSGAVATRLSRAETMGGYGAVYVAARADLDGVSDPKDKQGAWVLTTTEAGEKGIWSYSVADTDWVRIGDLPISMSLLTDVGGTANAITAKTLTSPEPSDIRALLLVPLYDNTDAVMLELDEEDPVPLLSAGGSDLTEGSLAAGVPTVILSDGANLRIMFPADVVTQVEALQIEIDRSKDLAESAASVAQSYANGQVIFDKVADIEGATIPAVIKAIRTNGYATFGDGGAWPLAVRMSYADIISGGYPSLSYIRSADRYLPNGTTDETNGGYWLLKSRMVTPAMLDSDVQSAWDYAALSDANCEHNESLTTTDDIEISDNLYVSFHQGAWLRPAAKSVHGSIVNNYRDSSADADSIMENIFISNPQIDFSSYPASVAVTVASATDTTVTFTEGASTNDDAYNGMFIENASDASAFRVISDYDGSTLTATISTAWATNPSVSNEMLIGGSDNAFGFAAGVSHITISNGIIKNVEQNFMVPSIAGGKAVNFERGVSNGRIFNVHAEDCGQAFFIQGVDGTFANGSKQRTTPIEILNCSAKNVGSVLTFAGTTGASDPDGDSDDSMIIAAGIVYENAGHSPYRFVSSYQQKSGIINLLEAQNVSVRNVRGRNDASYPGTSPGYPTDYVTRVGYGLTGDVGAVIWGWGRNIDVDGIIHHGNVDNVVAIRRGRALGDDAGPTGAPQNCYNWHLKNLEILGTVNEYLVRIDPIVTFRVPASELTGYIEISCNGSNLGLGLIDPNMSSFQDVTLRLIDLDTGKVVIGSPKQILAFANSFDDYDSGLTDLRVQYATLSGKEYSLDDDTAIAITPPFSAGAMLVTGIASQLVAEVRYRVVTSGQCSMLSAAAANFTAIDGDGSLTGEDGADGQFSVQANSVSGNIYIENRRGGTINFHVSFRR